MPLPRLFPYANECVHVGSRGAICPGLLSRAFLYLTHHLVSSITRRFYFLSSLTVIFRYSHTCRHPPYARLAGTADLVRVSILSSRHAICGSTVEPLYVAAQQPRNFAHVVAVRTHMRSATSCCTPNIPRSGMPCFCLSWFLLFPVTYSQQDTP